MRLGVEHIHWLGMQLLPLVGELGLRGIPFDSQRRDSLVLDIRGRMDRLTSILFGLGITAPGSSKRLATDLVAAGLPLTKQTAGGGQLATDLEVLSRLNHHYNKTDGHIRFPMLAPLIEWKRLEKARANLESLVPCKDGKLRTALRSIGTETGRYSSAGLEWCPVCKERGHGSNLQNISRPNEALNLNLRECFVAPPGWVFWELDHSMLELRIMAYLANCVKLIERFESGADVHKANTLALFNGQYNSDLRVLAKNFVFACVPMDTKALTKEGWKTRGELKVGDLILTYNQHTGMKEWAPIEAFAYRESDEVVELRHNQSFCVRATKDHRWFVRNRRGLEFVQTTEEINTESNIVVNAPMTPEMHDAIPLPTLEKYDFDWVRTVACMNTAQRSSFLQGFLLADGYINRQPTSTNWAWNQNVNNISEALLTATYLEHNGVLHVTNRVNSAGNNMIECRLSTKSHVTGQKLTKKVIGRESVWCPVTRNGSWVMRQGNCITITGNCIYGGSEGAIQMALAKKEQYVEQALIRELLLKLFREYPEIATWQQYHATLVQRALRATRQVVARNFLGRAQVMIGDDPLKEVLSHTVQGSAGDIMSCTLVRLREEVRQYLVIQIHDAMVGCSPQHMVQAHMREVAAEMERPVWLGGRFASFPVEGKMGTCWGKMEKCEVPRA